jgi:hypothetical protein
MANLKALGGFVWSLKGDQLFNTGVVGSTSNLQQQLIELRKSFAQLQSNPNNQEATSNFYQSLLTAHAVSLITDDELHQCESWLEES